MLSHVALRSSRAIGCRLSQQAVIASLHARSHPTRGLVASAIATPFRTVPRRYSDSRDIHIQDNKYEEEEDDGEPDLETSESQRLQKQLEAKDKEIVDFKDKYLRAVADFRNLQERTKREVQATKDFAIQRFARDLIDSVDNLDRALSTVSKDKLIAENKDLVTLYDGLRMTDTVMVGTLQKHGLERFDPSIDGEKFDPNLHEAVLQTPMPDKEDGSCFFTQRTGFLLNGRILRPAQVGVVKNT